MKQNRIVPYYLFSYPDYKTSLNLCKKIVSIFDTVEIGYPFSDPLADGPVIQAAGTETLANNDVNFPAYFKFVNELNKEDTKIYCMTYINPIISYGVEKYFQNAKRAGLYGLIIPDMPIEESENYVELANKYNLKLTFLVTTITDENRIKQIADVTTGFIYFATYTGVTGKQVRINRSLIEKISIIKKISKKEVYAGFGIRTKEDVNHLLKYVDRVIIGSAIINKFNERRRIDDVINYLNTL